MEIIQQDTYFEIQMQSNSVYSKNGWGVVPTKPLLDINQALKEYKSVVERSDRNLIFRIVKCFKQIRLESVEVSLPKNSDVIPGSKRERYRGIGYCDIISSGFAKLP